jgi:hypothetical protein
MSHCHLSALIALIALAAHAGGGDPEQDVHHDFRGQPLPESLTLFQPKDQSYIHPEAEGLRITLPKERKDLAAVGLARTAVIRGDFEITLTYEILEAEAPPQFTFGVGVNIYVKKAEPRAEGATLCRLVRDNGQQVVFFDRSHVLPGKEPAFTGDAAPCADKVGRLRLHRTGTVLHYLRAPGIAGDDFEEVHRCEFGAEDIQRVELRGTTGRYPCKLDARLLEVRIRSGPSIPIRELAAPPAPAPEKGRRLLLLLAALAVIAVTGAGLALRRFVQRRVVVPAAARREVGEVSCPHCQKRLQVPAGSAGKKNKCPGCAKVFVA